MVRQAPEESRHSAFGFVPMSFSRGNLQRSWIDARSHASFSSWDIGKSWRRGFLPCWKFPSGVAISVHARHSTQGSFATCDWSRSQSCEMTSQWVWSSVGLSASSSCGEAVARRITLPCRHPARRNCSRSISLGAGSLTVGEEVQGISMRLV